MEFDRKKRAQLYIQAQHIALGEGAWISLDNTVGQALVKSYVHGLIGTEVYAQLVPKNDDWSNVTIDKH